MQIERLAYSPAICPDETLWSWVTRVALYHGWSADEFLRLLGFGAPAWEAYLRQIDVDCAAPGELLDRLAQVTGFDRRELADHHVEGSPSTLWLDDRVAFCESCWSEGGASAVPYVRRAWLDAWCIDCPVHACPLVTIQHVYRPRQGADWNAAWASRANWAHRTNALCTTATAELIGRGSFVIARPPGAFLRELADALDTAIGDAQGGGRHNLGSGSQDDNAFLRACEKRLVLLAGRHWREFSLVRAFFNIREPVTWRNSARGYDAQQPVLEPVGSLVIRSGAIRIGRTLVDVLFERPYREPRIAGPLRRWISDLYGKPRTWLLRELAAWPAPVRERWKRQFEWGDELEWLRYRPCSSTDSLGAGIQSP